MSSKKRPVREQGRNGTVPASPRGESRKGTESNRVYRTEDTPATAPNSSDSTQRRLIQEETVTVSPRTPRVIIPPTLTPSPALITPVALQTRDHGTFNAVPAATDPGFTQQNITPQIIEALFVASEKRMLKAIVSHQRVVLSKISNLSTSIRDISPSLANINSNLKDLKMMMLPGATNGNSSLQSTRVGHARTRNHTIGSALYKEVVLENPSLPTELNVIFGTDIASVAVSKAIVSQINRFHQRRDDVSITARIMNVILFGLPKQESKAEWKYGLARRHANFRFLMAMNLLNQAKALPTHSFEFVMNDSMQRSGDACPDVTKPSWRTSDMMNTRTITLARKQHECLKTEKPTVPEGSQQRKALLISRSIFKVVVDMLRQSREKAKIRMFEDGLCFLLDWERLQCFPKDFKNPLISFLYAQAALPSIQDIPDSVQGNSSDVKDTNAALLREMISQRKEMLVEVVYDVHVSKSIKKKNEMETKKLRRIMNLLRISNSFLCSFCHVSEDKLSSSDPAMLKCLYRFSSVIRKFFATKIETAIGRNSVVASGAEQREANLNEREHDVTSEDRNFGSDRMIEQPANVESSSRAVPQIDLPSLMPSNSEKDRIVLNTVSVTIEYYKAFHKPSDSELAQSRESDSEPDSFARSLVEDIKDGIVDGDMSDMITDEDE